MRIQIYPSNGLCYEDIVVLGQFCAEVNAQWLFLSTKCSVRDMKKISTNFCQGALITKKIHVSHENLKKLGQSMSILLICYSRWQKTVLMPDCSPN